jgi:hypothetical protein
LKSSALAGVYLDETRLKIMKKHLFLFLSGSLLSFNLAFAQPSPMPPMDKDSGEYVWVRATNSLTKFDLDFPGGTPRDLVKAIEKATHKTLNTVIPEQNANLKIPAISVKNVTVVQLFEVLGKTSAHHERHVWRAFSDSMHQETLSNPITYYEREFTYGFRTEGVPNDNSIWYLYCDGDPIQVEPKVCRFFQLSPYLDAGYTVEDITTTIKTGWDMLGITNAPEISYHKDTKVLIAVGEMDKVDLIGDVLKQLSTTPKAKTPDNQDSDKIKTQ